MFVFLDPRPSVLILDPWFSAPRPSALKILQEQIHEWSILLIQDYTYSKLKRCAYSRYSASYLESLSYGVQNKWKGFFITVDIFHRYQKKRKKLFGEIHSVSSQLQLFLNIKTFPIYKPHTCSICSEPLSP